MMVYLSTLGKSSGTQNIFSVAASGKVDLLGSEFTSDWKGLLFYSDRNAPARSHKFGGQGAMSLTGSIYAANLVKDMLAAPNTYQDVTLGGGSGSTTTVAGQIVTSVLKLAGGSGITMALDPAKQLYINQVALVE